MRGQRQRRVRIRAIEHETVGGECIDRRRVSLGVAVDGQAVGAQRVDRMRTTGPLIGADARAKRRPADAASAVEAATSTSIAVSRRAGRLFQAVELGSRLSRLGRYGVDGQDFVQVLEAPGLSPLSSARRAS